MFPCVTLQHNCNSNRIVQCIILCYGIVSRNIGNNRFEYLFLYSQVPKQDLHHYIYNNGYIVVLINIELCDFTNEIKYIVSLIFPFCSDINKKMHSINFLKVGKSAGLLLLCILKSIYIITAMGMNLNVSN